MGHAPNGNPDCGAYNKSTGLRESDVNYSIGKKVEYYLSEVGFDIMTVQDDDLQTICNLSNNYGADLFVSIHCNSAENEEAKGTETFYGSDTNFAECIQKQIINILGTVDRGIKDGNHLYVIKYTDCKAVLVECGFISNIEDERMLSDENKQDELARAISRGITDYISSNN